MDFFCHLAAKTNTKCKVQHNPCCLQLKEDCGQTAYNIYSSGTYAAL